MIYVEKKQVLSIVKAQYNECMKTDDGGCAGTLFDMYVALDEILPADVAPKSETAKEILEYIRMTIKCCDIDKILEELEKKYFEERKNR